MIFHRQRELSDNSPYRHIGQNWSGFAGWRVFVKCPLFGKYARFAPVLWNML
jgi:hypothetical protein